jgi:hypothetical protein
MLLPNLLMLLLLLLLEESPRSPGSIVNMINPAFRIFLDLYYIQCPIIPELPTDYTTFPEKHTNTSAVPAFKFITKPHTKPKAA